MCHLYAPKTSSTKVNELRYHLFYAKKGEVESHLLPPCRDCLVSTLFDQIFRLLYGKDVQNRTLVFQVLKARDGRLKYTQPMIHWMTGQPAPQAILNPLACNCAKKCELPRCICMTNGLKCTEVCGLQDCGNQADHADDDEDVINEFQDELEEDCDF